MAKKLAFSSIMVALNIMFLYLSCIVPTNTIFLFCFSTVFIGISIMECGTAMGMASIISAAILSLFLIPDKILAICFSLFFSFYPLIKYYAEKLKSRVFEWIIKLFSVSIAMIYLYNICRIIFAEEFILNLPLIWLFAAGIFVFVLYDIALSIAITLYKKQIAPRIRL